MSVNQYSAHSFQRSAGKITVFLLVWSLFAVLPETPFANPDVYGVLPADTRVLQYGLADFNGDKRSELAVLYTTAHETRLTLFSENSGRWARWWDDNGAVDRKDGISPKSMETADINGDGKDEILLYYLTEKNSAMAARILALDDRDPPRIIFGVLLEDSTSPPGYPLLGTEDGDPGVTFMRMATRDSNGYRRVYCWDGEAFEVCKEVVWEKP